MSRPTLRAGFVAALAASAGLMASRVAVDPMWIGLDQALNLQYGEALLAGGVPYVTFVDTNPPMIFYASAVPVALARAFGAHPVPVFSLIAIALTVASVWSLYRALDGIGHDRARAAAASGYLVFSLGVFHFGLLGQREHLFALAAVPFLALRHARATGAPPGRAASLVAGFAAGLAACLKPHFLVVLLAPEALRVAGERSPRALVAPELAAGASSVLLFAAHFAFVPREMRDAAFGRWFPLLVSGYAAYDAPDAVLVRDALVVAVPALVALLVCRASPVEAARALAPPLALSTAAGLAVYWGQHKGYVYHLLPAVAPASILVGLGAVAAWESLAGRRPRALAAPAAAILAAVALYDVAAGARNAVRARDPALRATASPFLELVERETAPGDAVLVISTSVAPASPALAQARRRPASRYYWTFPIALAYHGARGRPPYRPPSEATADELAVLSELAADVAASRPRLVLVDHSGGCQGCPRRFDLWDYLVAVGFADEALRGYVVEGETEGFVRLVPGAS